MYSPSEIFLVYSWAEEENVKIYVKMLTVCSYHATYVLQSESTLYSCLNVEELLV